MKNTQELLDYTEVSSNREKEPKHRPGDKQRVLREQEKFGN